MATCDVCGRPKAGCGGGPVCWCLGYAAQRARADRLAAALRVIAAGASAAYAQGLARKALAEEPER